MRLLPLLVLLAGCRSADPPAAESPPARPALSRTRETGRRIYLRCCAGCHGEQGDGAGRNSPNLTRPAQFPRSLSATAIADWLRGRRDRSTPECPDWQHTFSDAERRAVADYMLTLFPR